MIDGAGDYGNEVEVGRGINKAIKEGIVKREDLFGKYFNISLLKIDEDVVFFVCSIMVLTYTFAGN